jgi:hypothetical protein
VWMRPNENERPINPSVAAIASVIAACWLMSLSERNGAPVLPGNETCPRSYREDIFLSPQVKLGTLWRHWRGRN